MGNLFLFAPALVLMALALLTPWPWFWRVWLLLAIAAAALTGYSPAAAALAGFSRPVPDPGVGHALAQVVVFFHGLHFAGLFALRAFIRGFAAIEGRVPKPVSRSERRRLAAFDGILGTAGGALAAAVAVACLAFVFSAMPGGYLIHSGIGLLLLAGTAILSRRPSFSRRRHWPLAVGFLLPMIAATIYGLFYPQIVLTEAEHVARDAAHCITLRDRHRPPRTSQDLTLFTMDKEEDRHHAVLLVDRGGKRETYHWSYRQQRFVPGIFKSSRVTHSVVACRPKLGFASGLPHWRDGSPHDHEIYFGGRDLVIPAGYRLRFSDTTLRLSAAAPDFRPVNRLPLLSYSSVEISSQARFGGSTSKLLTERPTGRIGDLVEVRDGPNGFDWYYRRTADRSVASLILCSGGRPSDLVCQHSFHRDGLRYKFDHSHALLSASAEMEDRLADLFKSFGW